jgi:hypothetical protein
MGSRIYDVMVDYTQFVLRVVLWELRFSQIAMICDFKIELSHEEKAD